MFETEIAEVTANSADETASETATTETPTAEQAASATEAAAGVLPEGAATEEAASEEKPQPAWATVTDAYDLFDLPEVKEIHERENKRLETQLRDNLQREFEDKHQNWDAENTARTLQSHLGRLQDRFSEGDAVGFEKALERLEAFSQPALERLRLVSYDEGAKASAANVGAQVKDAFTTGMDRRAKDRFDDIWNSPGITWEKIFDFREKALIEKATQPLQAELKEAKDELARLKVRIREGQGHVVDGGTGTGSAGVTSMADAERRYVLPDRHPEKISHEQYKAARERFGVKR